MADTLQMMKDFLISASDDEWFFVATTMNYDDKDLLHWMAEHSTCPQAAAQAIYWMMGPGYYTKFKSVDETAGWEKPTFELLRDIEKRFGAKFYKDSAIGFVPSADSMGKINWVAEYPDSPVGVPIPEFMKAQTPGRNLSRSDIPEGWDDGMPPHVVQVVWSDLDEE